MGKIWDRGARIRWAFRVALGLGPLLLGCAPLEGGAVEGSWVIHTPDGRGISSCGCSEPVVARVRFRVENAATGQDVCSGRADCEFACGRPDGATPFFVPPGRYAISVRPIGAGGVDLTLPRGDAGVGQLHVPAAAVLREVVRGQVTQLEAFLIQAPCASACGGAEPGRVCTAN